MTKTSKEKLHQSGESFKQAGKSLKDTIIAGAKTIGNVIKGAYQVVDAGDKRIGEGIEKKMKEKGKNTTGKVKKILRNNIIKLAICLGLLTYGGIKTNNGVNDSKKDNKEIVDNQKEGSYVEKFGNDSKVFIIDVSENNKYEKEKFKNWNEGNWNRNKKDVRGLSGIYLRIQNESGIDKDCKAFFKEIKEYNKKNTESGQEIAVGGYIYFNKATDAITDSGIEKQVNTAISKLNTLNEEGDGVVDLRPMIDFEYSNIEQNRWKTSHPNENYPSANSEIGKKNKKAVLKRLKMFEEKTGITPGIYTGGDLYNAYFYNDPDFKKYPIRLASYNRGRVDQSEDGHSVKIGPKNEIEIQPHLVQFNAKIHNSGFGTENGDNLDGNTTTKDKFQELIIKNNDAPNDLK